MKGGADRSERRDRMKCGGGQIERRGGADQNEGWADRSEGEAD